MKLKGELKPIISFVLVFSILLSILFTLSAGMRNALGINETWQRSIRQWHYALSAMLDGEESGNDDFTPLTATLESESFQALIRFSPSLSEYKESLEASMCHMSAPYTLKSITEIEIELDNITEELNVLSSQQLSSFESLFFVSYLLIALLMSLYGIQGRQLAIAREEKIVAAELRKITTLIYEKERKKIARDLHDGLSQNIALARMSVDKLPEGNEKKLLRLSLDQSFKEIRKLLFNLRSEEDFSGSLTKMVKRECELFQERFDLAVTVHVGKPFRPSWEVEHFVQFFRILHEGLINVVRHSGTMQAEVELDSHPGFVELYIRDKGKGLEKTKPGLGLKGMNERNALLGGSLEWNSFTGKGTEIHLSVPDELS
jgi:signal transduction histidine kinase